MALSTFRLVFGPIVVAGKDEDDARVDALQCRLGWCVRSRECQRRPIGCLFDGGGHPDLCARGVFASRLTQALAALTLLPPAPLAAHTFQQLCVHWPFPWQYPDPLQIMSFSFIRLVATIIGWLFGVDHIMPPMSCHVYFLYLWIFVHLFFWGMKADLLRMIIPANSGVIVERWWVNDWGNPELCRIVVWGGGLALPPFGTERLRGGDKGHAREGC